MNDNMKQTLNLVMNSAHSTKNISASNVVLMLAGLSYKALIN